jgi:hypothetical protein
LSWWGKLILKLYTDSEDWRLAYISFFFLLVGTVLMFLVKPLQVVFFAASFITARAALAAAGSEDLGAQKWLLYPILLLVSAAFVLTLLLGPGLLAGITGAALHEIPWVRRASHMGVVAFVITSATLVTSLWWMLLGVLLCMWPGLIRPPLRPFADRFNRRRALAVSGAGVLLLVPLAGFIALYMNGGFVIFME